MIDSTQLETQKQELLTHIKGWSPARLSYRPSPAAWSSVEVLDHLVKTEESILAFAKRGLAKPHRIGIRDRLGSLFIQKIFQTDRKVKVPAAAAQVLPDRRLDLDSILQRWQSTRNDFAAFQRQLSPEQARLGIFRHPVCGWMGIPQIVAFFSVHMVHHGFQLSRLRSQTQTLE